MKTADNAELCQVIEAIGLPAVLEQCAEDTRPSGGASA